MIQVRIILSNKIRCKRCDYLQRVIRTTEGGKYEDYCEELSEWVEVPAPDDDD